MGMGGSQHMLSGNDFRMKLRIENSNGENDSEKRAMRSSSPGQRGPHGAS